MMFTSRSLFVLSTLLLAAPWLAAQSQKKYDGPRPPKPDVPYLLHARHLVETDVTEAKEEKLKNDLRYTLPGTAKARTPMMEPIFLMQSDKLVPEKLTCYRMEVKNGQRELTISAKAKRDSSGRPRRLTVTLLGDKLFKIELAEALDNGEYVLTPEGSNQSFAFSVY